MIALIGVSSFVGFVVLLVQTIRAKRRRVPVKRYLIGSLACFVLLCVMVSLDSSGEDSANGEQREQVEPEQSEKQVEEQAEPEQKEEQADEQAEPEQIEEQADEQAEPEQKEDQVDKQAEPEQIEEQIESEENVKPLVGKDIGTVTLYFEKSIRNDVTGKWRLAKTADNIHIQEYAVSYYNTYFKSDDEIHFIIDFTNNTTSKVTYLLGMLEVDVYERVDKEEHDAKILPGGRLLAQYWVDMKTGEIENLDS